jgi:hypothetical protein
MIKKKFNALSFNYPVNQADRFFDSSGFRLFIVFKPKTKTGALKIVRPLISFLKIQINFPASPFSLRARYIKFWCSFRR